MAPAAPGVPGAGASFPRAAGHGLSVRGGTRTFRGRRGTVFPGGGVQGKMPQPYSLSMAGEVSPLGSGSGSGDEVVSAGQVRASHEDRDRYVEMLQLAAGDGRLTAEELDERLEVALTARTYGELAALTADLPVAPGLPMGGPVAKPKDVVLIDCHSGNVKRDGHWAVPQRLEVRVTSGNVKVRTPWGHDVPVTLRIGVSGKVGSGNITARPPRRTFWQWLRRAPRPYAIASR